MKYLIRRYGPPQLVKVPRPWIVYPVLGNDFPAPATTYETWREALDFALSQIRINND